MRFNVSMTYTHGVNVGHGPQQLVSVQLHKNIGHIQFLFHMIFHDLVQGLRHMLHDHVEVDFIRRVTIGIEIVLHLDAKRVP